MTGYASIDTAVEAIRHGAYDYITKPFQLDQLKTLLRRMVSYDTDNHQRFNPQSVASVAGLLAAPRAQQPAPTLPAALAADAARPRSFASDALIVSLFSLDVQTISQAFHPRTPVRWIGGYMLLFALLLGGLWGWLFWLLRRQNALSEG